MRPSPYRPGVTRPVRQPAYLRIADDLRREIVAGTLSAGVRVPSRHQLAERYNVSDRVAVQAVRLLVSEGFLESRSGSGTYVRGRPSVRRLTRSWYRQQRGDSPFRADMAAQDKVGDWTCRSERTTATSTIADRLAITSGDAVMRTGYVFRADGEPVMLSTSYEPLDVTGDTAVVFPEEGPQAGRGVVERMAAIGWHITHAAEVVTARPVLAEEAESLRSPIGTVVLVVQRTYHTDERPVETADIVIPTDRYELMYATPVSNES